MISEIRRRFELGEKVGLECVDVNSFLSHKNGKYRAENKIILSSDLVVKNVVGSTWVIEIEDCDYNITRDELRYFRIKAKQERGMSYSEKLINKDAKFQEMLAVASNAVDNGVLSSFTVNDMDYSDMIGKGLYLGLNMTYHAIESEIKGIEKMMDENKTVEQEVKELTFDDLIDAAVQAQKYGLINNIRIDSNDQYLSFVDKDNGLIGWNKNQISNCIDYINSLYIETFVIDKEYLMPKVKDEAKVTLSNGNSFIARKVEHSFVVMKDGSEVKSLMFKDHNDFWVTYSFFELKGATVTQQKGNNNTAFNLEAFKNQAYTAMTKTLDQDIAKFNEGNK